MHVKEIKEAVEEIKGLSDSTVRHLWSNYIHATMVTDGCVIRENNWTRFKAWLTSSPLDYLSSCETNLILAMTRKLNISEIKCLSPGELPVLTTPYPDRSYLLSTATLGKYVLVRKQSRLYPSIIDIPLFENEDGGTILDKYEWDADSIEIALDTLNDAVLNPIYYSHESRCDIEDIRLYIRETLPATKCLYVGVIAQCIETGSRFN